MCNKGTTQFYLPPTHEPYLPFLPSCKASLPFGWYSLRLPTKGWPGWVDLRGWFHNKINVMQQELNLDTVTHPSTNWAGRRLTLLIETNMLPLCQTTTGSLSHTATSIFHETYLTHTCCLHLIFHVFTGVPWLTITVKIMWCQVYKKTILHTT